MRKLLCLIFGHRRRWTLHASFLSYQYTTCRCIRCGADLTEGKRYEQ